MSLEAAIAELTAAVRENTEAHAKLAAVAVAASKAGKDKPAAEVTGSEEPKAEKPKAEKPKAERPKAEKPKAEKPKAKPEVQTDVDEAAIPGIAVGFLGTDDESVREDRKAKMRSALDHLGFKKASEIDNDEDRVKFATYVAYWSAGHEVDFEEIDALVAEAVGDSGSEDDDDMV